jgi:hypothetical protein
MENKTSTSDSFLRFFEAALPEGLAATVRENLRAAATIAFDKMDFAPGRSWNSLSSRSRNWKKAYITVNPA